MDEQVPSQYHFAPVVVPQELRDDLWAAHEAMKGKQAHIGRLKQGRKDIDAEIAAARIDLDAVKKSHLDSFESFASDAVSLPAEAKKAKAKIAEIGGMVVGLEETLPDFAAAIRKAEDELRDLRSDMVKARREIVKLFVSQVPRIHRPPGDLNTLSDYMAPDMAIDFGTVMLLYLAFYESIDNEGGGPFPHRGGNPDGFFTFMARFFRKPNGDEIAGYRTAYEVAIWGEGGAPDRIEMPEPHTPDDGISSAGLNWNALSSP